MAAVGIILSGSDGMVLAADTFPGNPGESNDSVRKLGHSAACCVYSLKADQLLQAYLGATQSLPASAADFSQSLAGYIQQQAGSLVGVLGMGFSIAGIDPNGLGPNFVEEIGWNGQTLVRRVFPGNLLLHQHSIPRYLLERLSVGNLSLTTARQFAAFLYSETRLALPEVRPHLAMATIDRARGFRWETEDLILTLLEQARQKSHKLSLGCLGLF